MKRLLILIFALLMILTETICVAEETVVLLDDPVYGENAIILDVINNVEFLSLDFTKTYSYNELMGKLLPGGEFEGWWVASIVDLMLMGDSAGIVHASADPAILSKTEQLRDWFGNVHLSSTHECARGLVVDQLGSSYQKAFSMGRRYNVEPNETDFRYSGYGGKNLPEGTYLMRESLITFVDNCPNLANPEQDDTYPPQGNGIGDACECEGNFDCTDDQNVDGGDTAIFRVDFGRMSDNNPCTNEIPCNGDFDCDYDVDGTDAILFKSDFGRSEFNNPCPTCEVREWCVYPDNGTIDECAEGLDDCVASSRCVDTKDSYVCDCGTAPPDDDYVVDQYHVNAYTGYPGLGNGQSVGQSFTIAQSGFLAGIEYSIAFYWSVVPDATITADVFPCSSPTDCSSLSLGPDNQ